MKEDKDMENRILGERFDEVFGLDPYDNYDPFEGEENEVIEEE